MTLLTTFARKYHVLLLIIFCSILFTASSVFYSIRSDSPSGDEPHYLIISQTLLKYHSLNVSLDYQHKDYNVFYHAPISPHVVANARGQLLPLHNIGGPLLWLLPYYLLGRLGAMLFISLLSVLIIFNIYKLILTLGIGKRYALLTSFAYSVASPIYLYAHLTFIEPIGALVCVYVVRKIFQKEISISEVAISSGLLGILPWIHIRFALFEMILFFALLYRIYREQGLRSLRYYVAYLVPIVLLFGMLEIYSYDIWGTLNPAANEIKDNSVPFQILPFKGMLGLFFDQQYGLLMNFPVFLFLLPGLVLTLKRRYWHYNALMLVLSLPYLLLVTSFVGWNGGWSPPARFLIVLLPLYSFYIAYTLERVNNWFVYLVYALSVAYGIVFNLLTLYTPGFGFNGETGRNHVLASLRIFEHSVTEYLPSFYLPNQKGLLAIWIAMTVLLSLLIIISRHDRPVIE